MAATPKSCSVLMCDLVLKNVEMSKDEKAERYQKLFDGDMGKAELFVEAYKTTIKIPSVKYGKAFIFNEDSALWEEKPFDHIKYKLIPQYLHEQYLNANHYYLTKYNKMEDMEKLKAIQSKLQGIAKVITSSKNADNVFQQVKVSEIVDEKFLDVIDKNKFLFPIKNKQVIDLRTGKSRERTKNDYFSYYSDVEIVEKTKEAELFFDQITRNSKKLKKQLLRCLGLCCSGDTSGRHFFVFYEKGANGKGTVINLCEKILGKRYTSLNKKVFIKNINANEGATPHLMPLRFATMGCLSETTEDDIINDSLIKALTGNNTISARALYQDEITFRTQTKLILQTNFLPRFKVEDIALIDRCLIFPFLCRFTDDPDESAGELQKDTAFVHSLEFDWIDQIFTLMVHGAVDWFANLKFEPTEESITAKNSYISELDTITNFINDKCDKDSKAKCVRADLYSEYKSFCVDTGEKARTCKDFSKKMRDMFGETKIGGVWKIPGIKIKLVKSEDKFINDDEDNNSGASANKTKKNPIDP